MLRINKTISKLESKNGSSELTQVKTCMIRPSRDIGEIAQEEMHNMPHAVRHLIRNMGDAEEAADLISYLLFEGPYTKRLIELGYQDANDKKDEILAFFDAPH